MVNYVVCRQHDVVHRQHRGFNNRARSFFPHHGSRISINIIHQISIMELTAISLKTLTPTCFFARSTSILYLSFRTLPQHWARIRKWRATWQTHGVSMAQGFTWSHALSWFAPGDSFIRELCLSHLLAELLWSRTAVGWQFSKKNTSRPIFKPISSSGWKQLTCVCQLVPVFMHFTRCTTNIFPKLIDETIRERWIDVEVVNLWCSKRTQVVRGHCGLIGVAKPLDG